ncbi:MAG: hypothetical protein LBQ44_03160, partial [Treponema sp.]|nr:hypothetical protein [Treponema sp.]
FLTTGMRLVFAMLVALRILVDVCIKRSLFILDAATNHGSLDRELTKHSERTRKVMSGSLTA